MTPTTPSPIERFSHFRCKCFIHFLRLLLLDRPKDCGLVGASGKHKTHIRDPRMVGCSTCSMSPSSTLRCHYGSTVFEVHDQVRSDCDTRGVTRISHMVSWGEVNCRGDFQQDLTLSVVQTTQETWAACTDDKPPVDDISERADLVAH